MTSTYKNTFIAILFLLAICFIGCQDVAQNKTVPKALPISSPTYTWNDYWYAGKAEVNSYQLVQSRYGQERVGTSVLVFVTEDFSKNKHVKLDYPNQNPSDKVSVLKTNMIRKFNTGIYDYSMMASIFTPVSADKYPHTLKVTTSSQEWCGHTWSQYNREKDGYVINGRSYFESEGDETSKLNADWLEDELWNRIRINPISVPTGPIKIIPGSFYSRLDHVPFGVEDAVLEKKEDDTTTTFNLIYKSIDRRLSITIKNQPPFKIRNWEETSKRGTTKARLMKSMHLPYWSMNGNEYEVYRDSLKLD